MSGPLIEDKPCEMASTEGQAAGSMAMDLCLEAGDKPPVDQPAEMDRHRPAKHQRSP